MGIHHAIHRFARAGWRVATGGRVPMMYALSRYARAFVFG
jgi:hypothetical protein